MSRSHERFYDAHAAATDRRGGFYQTFVLRPLSLPLSWPFLRLGVSANQATGIGSALGLVAALLAALGQPGTFVAAAVLWHMAVVMDFVDGNLARAQTRKTWSGKLFDGLSDVLLDGAFLIAVGFGLSMTYGALAACAAWANLAGLYARMRLLYVSGLIRRAPEPSRSAEAARGRRFGGLPALFERIDREVTLPALLLAAVTGWMDAWLILAAGFRVGTGIINLAGTVYRGSVDLNIIRSA